MIKMLEINRMLEILLDCDGSARTDTAGNIPVTVVDHTQADGLSPSHFTW